MVADASLKPNTQKRISVSSSVGASKSRDASFWIGVSAVVRLHNHSCVQEASPTPKNDLIDTAANKAQVYRFAACIPVSFRLYPSQLKLLAGCVLDVLRSCFHELSRV